MNKCFIKKYIMSPILAAACAASICPAFSSPVKAVDIPLEARSGSFLVYDRTIGYIKGIPVGMTVGEISKEFDGEVTVSDINGRSLSADECVGTDFSVSADGKMSKLLLYGDIERDGRVDANDVSLYLKYLAEYPVEINLFAGDVNLDGKSDAVDVSDMLKYLAEWEITLGYINSVIAAEPFAREVIRLVNEERTKEGLSPLTELSVLTSGAQIRAGELTTLFSHTRPDGRSCFSVIEDIGTDEFFYTMGENIAAGYASPADVVDGWMNSPDTVQTL